MTATHPGREDHEREQCQRWLELSHLERLRWREDAQRFHALVHAARKRR
jgi:hypothetical protein